MNHKMIGTRVVIGLVVAMALASCGGGSGDGGGSTSTPSVQLSGTAATGAPFAGAAISILDKSGTVVGSGTSGADGSFSITLSGGATGPFVLQAVRDDQTLVSIAPDTVSGTVNITPITNLIASRLSASGDPTKLAAEFKANPNLLTSVTVSAKVDEIVALLKPLLDALGATANPLTGKFAADGTGSDRVLDSLFIKISPESATTTNIEVSVKQNLADGIQPQPLQFSSASTTIASLLAVTAASLVKPGTAPLIAALLVKMNACYALPVADRVDTPDTNNVAASGIKATACKELFYNNDPSTFKSNGRVVSSNTAFANIFRTGGNNLVFDRGTYEFTRANGDIVIGYRSTDSSGNVTNDTFAVRADDAEAPTKLQQIGNQYAYDGAIKPYHQLRTFVNQAGSDYYSTGYVPAVNNTLSGTTPIFNKVLVTTPKGSTLTLMPNPGYSTLQLAKAGTVTGTSFVRLRSVYTSADKASLDPATADTQLFFASPAQTDADITSIPQQAVWKFEYFLAANTGATPDATQYYRTRSRALSIGELTQHAFANLEPSLLTDLVAESSANGSVAAPPEGPTLDWVVGSGALPPTSLTVWGFGGGKGFNDSLTVGSTVRTATIPCVNKSATDGHCTGGVNVASSYVAGRQLNGLHLFARDPVGREFAHFYATYSIGSASE
jgi:hypothetical protein